jgi:hypothetical protein
MLVGKGLHLVALLVVPWLQVVMLLLDGTMLLLVLVLVGFEFMVLVMLLLLPVVLLLVLLLLVLRLVGGRLLVLVD